jgi:hypothetical protein
MAQIGHFILSVLSGFLHIKTAKTCHCEEAEADAAIPSKYHRGCNIYEIAARQSRAGSRGRSLRLAPRNDKS